MGRAIADLFPAGIENLQLMLDDAAREPQVYLNIDFGGENSGLGIADANIWYAELGVICNWKFTAMSPVNLANAGLIGRKVYCAVNSADMC